MSSSRVPAHAADEESAPLLQNGARHDEDESFFTRISNLTQEPLSYLSKILLGVILVLLILSSVFLGLFVGVEHRLSKIENGEGQEKTVTATETSTSITTTTIISTAPPSEPTTPPTEIPCADSDCIVLAASVLNSMDISMDPCEDFFGFANGGWMKEHPVPADKGRYGHFDEVALKNKLTIKQILDQAAPSLPSPDSSTLTKLQTMYESCMNEALLNKLGSKPIFDIVNTVKRLFNESSTIVGASHKDQHVFMASNRGLTAALAYLHSQGIDALFEFLIEGDAAVDPNNMTLWFYQPGFGLPAKEYFEEQEIVDKYTSTLERFFTALDGETSDEVNFWPPFPWPPWGGDDDDDKEKPKTPSELAKAVVEFEGKIAAATLDLDRLQQDPFGTYNPMPASNLSSSIPQIDFPAYWSSFTPRNFPERIIVTYPAYVDSLSSLLSNTSSDVIEGYLIARVTQSLAEYLGLETEIWKANRELVELLSGIKKGAVGDRAEYCATQVTNTMGFAAGRFFVEEVFGGESRSKATRVITDIVEAFKKSLPGMDWMDKASAEAAAQKATNIRVKVGFPLSPNTSDATAISNYYSRLAVNKSDFMGNIQRAAAFESYLQWQQLGKKRDKETWEMIPSEVNAYFNPPSNEIVFPAGILQEPYFSKDWPGYLNYGAFGAVAAHELTHAFDSAGRLYDENGKLREWWTNKTSEGFEERRECLSQQYSNYTVDDGQGGRIHVNGNLTSGENIGDQGLIQAYRAWKLQYNTSLEAGNEFLLPGLNFTREQLFFIAFGRVWGSNIRPQAAVQQVRTDPHSPAQFRVLGTLVNIPAFAEAFSCPIGSKMNPPETERCRLW